MRSAGCEEGEGTGTGSCNFRVEALRHFRLETDLTENHNKLACMEIKSDILMKIVVNYAPLRRQGFSVFLRLLKPRFSR